MRFRKCGTHTKKEPIVGYVRHRYKYCSNLRSNRGALVVQW